MDARPQSKWLDKLVFLGTGTSSQVPAIPCVTGAVTGCVTCEDAMKPGSKNRRGCTAALAIGSAPGGPSSCIVIDCGKTFYQSALDCFPKYGLKRIDAVLLTHAHADAILGLDDLRSWTMRGTIQDYVDVFLTQECFSTVQNTFPYLVNRKLATGGGDVGALRWHIISATERFYVGPHKVPIDPLRVDHGYAGPERHPFECLGFRIDTMSYISDCHNIPQATTDKMIGSTAIVLDALMMRPHPSHYSVPQAIEYALGFADQQSAQGQGVPLVLFTDVCHRMEHHSFEASVQQFLAGLNAYREKHQDATGAWWEEIWDARENEESLELRLRSDPGAMQQRCLPEMHVTYDGLCIDFRKV
ncbi:hypothetical protein MCUN1_002914 [Malassezia cuniculi]|uniref:Metallo-beta-lactamase domain-containing protein n=1 Tax=Malassezia cuniculi TaxID=948313 RepID=A0AAF0J7A8_9BASI|nr:hypothetical protein MCUN1_002914 [Malassezia cuniculi]